jgi:hypothetical protein
MKKNIGLLGEIQEELRKSEEGRKRLFSDLQQREAEAQKRTQDILLGTQEERKKTETVITQLRAEMEQATLQATETAVNVDYLVCLQDMDI